MPMIELHQGNRTGLIYGSKIPHKRTFLLSNTIIGLSNKHSGFSKDKLIIFQDGHTKYILKETNRINWALKRILPICVLFLYLILQIFFPYYELLWVLLFIASIMMADSFINQQYAVFEGKEKVGSSLIKPINCFSIQNNIYRIYSHGHECYSLFKNETQIALYARKLEKAKSKYLIYYSAEEPIEIIELFCLWIDMFNYDDERGRTILKTFSLFPDKHIEHTVWRPKDAE